MDLADLARSRTESARAQAVPDPLLRGGQLPFLGVEDGAGAASRRPSPMPEWTDRVQVCEVGCMRLCCEGPLVQVDPDGPLYQRVGAGRNRLDRGGARRCDHGHRASWRPASAVLRETAGDRAGKQRVRRARTDRVVHRGRAVIKHCTRCCVR